MKEIPLTRGRVALVDDADYPFLIRLKWHAYHDMFGHWYAVNSLPHNGSLRMHHLLLQVEKGETVDHKDGNGLNNQRDNLRRATKSKNGANAKLSKRNSLGFKGVAKRENGKYRAQIGGSRTCRHIGTFETAMEAAMAYDSEALKQWGEFALTNQRLGLL